MNENQITAGRAGMNARGTAALAGLILTICAAVLGAGCSSTQMMSAPAPLWDRADDWDKDGRQREALGDASDRINVWPFYYYRKPAMSVLWPLYTKAGANHSLAPVYDWDSKKKHLHLGVFTTILPSLAFIDKKDGDWRALNVIREDGGDEWKVLPLYFYSADTSDCLLLPVMHLDWGGGETEFWTPLWMQTEDLQGALGPFFNRYRDGGDEPWTYNAPWPFVAWWKGGEKAGFRTPVFSWDREDDATHQDSLYGALYYRDAEPGRTIALAGMGALGGYHRDFQGKTHWATPLWFSVRQSGYAMFLSLPYASIRSDCDSTRVAGLLGWIEHHTPTSKYNSVLFPLFHYYRDEHSTTRAVAPLAALVKNDDGRTGFYSPLVSFTSDGSLRNLGLILYHESSKDGERFQSVLWPLAFRRTAPGRDEWMVAPLAYYKRDENGATWVSPVSSGRRGEGAEWTNVLGLLYHESENRKENERSVWALWPLYHNYEKNDSSYRWLLPLFGSEHHSDGGAFYTALYSRGKWSDRSFWNAGGVILTHERNPKRIETNMLLLSGFRRYLNKGGGFKAYVYPFFSYHSTPSMSDFWSLMSTSFRSRKTESGLRDEIEKDIADRRAEYEKDLEKPQGACMAGTYDWRRHPRISRCMSERELALGIYHSDTKLETVWDEDEREDEYPSWEIVKTKESWLFPVYSYEAAEGRNSQFELFWWLFDRRAQVDQETGEVLSRSRVLWRFYHRECAGDRVSTDVFPFIALDRGEGLRKFSFAGGLFEIGASDGVRQGKIFWIPFGEE